MSKLFAGTGVAVVTALKVDGSIDYQAQENIYKKLIESKVDYIVILGSTGEGATITIEEQKELLEFSKKKIPKRTKLVIGVSGNNTAEVLSRIDDFDLRKVDGILSAAPSYNKPTQEGIFLHFKNICEASPVPVIIYNVPSRTSSNISFETTLRIARELPNAVAIKEASGDLIQVMKILAEKPEDFKVLSGDDYFALPIIALGGEGLVSVIGNAYPEEIVEMIKLARRNKMKEARKIHNRIFPLLDLIFEEGNPAGVKGLLHLMNKCQPEVRLPLLRVSQDLLDRIKRSVP